MKLCGYCLAALFPRNYSMRGSAQLNDGRGEPAVLNASNVADLVKSGARICDAQGYVMAMRPVAIVRGSHVCAQHAIEEVQART